MHVVSDLTLEVPIDRTACLVFSNRKPPRKGITLYLLSVSNKILRPFSNFITLALACFLGLVKVLEKFVQELFHRPNYLLNPETFIIPRICLRRSGSIDRRLSLILFLDGFCERSHIETESWRLLHRYPQKSIHPFDHAGPDTDRADGPPDGGDTLTPLKM